MINLILLTSGIWPSLSSCTVIHQMLLTSAAKNWQFSCMTQHDFSRFHGLGNGLGLLPSCNLAQQHVIRNVHVGCHDLLLPHTGSSSCLVGPLLSWIVSPTTFLQRTLCHINNSIISDLGDVAPCKGTCRLCFSFILYLLHCKFRRKELLAQIVALSKTLLDYLLQIRTEFEL